MCGRYQFTSDEDSREMRAIVEEINRRYKDKPELAMMKTGEIFPTNVVPVFANSKKLEPSAFLMKWGFAPYARGGKAGINARSETALDRKTFREPLLTRRCAVPASCYYEWLDQGDIKIKHAIKPAGQNIIYMAGIYRMEADQPLPVFTILTRDASKGIAHIHDRMPVILYPEEKDAWIRPDADIQAIMAHSQEQMEYMAV